MKRSTDRILTSHAGSLHRPDDIRATMAARKDGEPFDDALSARIKEGVKEVVRLQHENGVDVVNDGEYTKRSWQTYSRGRLNGLEFRPLKEGEPRDYGSITKRESQHFPEFFQLGVPAFGGTPGGRGGNQGVNVGAPAAGGGGGPEGVFCVGPLKYIGQEEYKRDIAWIKELTHSFYLKSERARRALSLWLYALNGVPSILFGILGLIVFVKFLGFGKSWLGGGVLLGLMILPTVTVSLVERIKVLPAKYVEAAAGLGLSRSQIVRSVVLPQSLGGLVTGLLLGLARAAGETAPIMFTATVFAGASLPRGMRESPVLSLPYHIFILAQDSFDPGVSSKVWGTATVLLALVLLLSVVALPVRLKVHEEARHG